MIDYKSFDREVKLLYLYDKDVKEINNVFFQFLIDVKENIEYIKTCNHYTYKGEIILYNKPFFGDDKKYLFSDHFTSLFNFYYESEYGEISGVYNWYDSKMNYSSRDIFLGKYLHYLGIK